MSTLNFLAHSASFSAIHRFLDKELKLRRAIFSGKIPLFLRGYHPSVIEDASVEQMTTPFRLLLNLDTDDHLIQPVFHEYIEDDIKITDALIDLTILCVKADNAFALGMTGLCICQSRIYGYLFHPFSLEES